MTGKFAVLAENSRIHNGVEYNSVTALDTSVPPLLQMIDYGLRPEEAAHKGKLVGKIIELQWENIRGLFSGRPQIVGRIISVNGGK